jgi:hypothetical protein
MQPTINVHWPTLKQLNTTEKFRRQRRRWHHRIIFGFCHPPSDRRWLTLNDNKLSDHLTAKIYRAEQVTDHDARNVITFRHRSQLSHCSVIWMRKRLKPIPTKKLGVCHILQFEGMDTFTESVHWFDPRFLLVNYLCHSISSYRCGPHICRHKKSEHDSSEVQNYSERQFIPEEFYSVKFRWHRSPGHRFTYR